MVCIQTGLFSSIGLYLLFQGSREVKPGMFFYATQINQVGSVLSVPNTLTLPKAHHPLFTSHCPVIESTIDPNLLSFT